LIQDWKNYLDNPEITPLLLEETFTHALPACLQSGEPDVAI